MVEQCVIYEKTYNEYGRVVITLEQVLNNKNVSLYKLSTLTGIKWEILKKYTTNSMYRVDLDLLAKVCYVLKCELADVLHYEKI